MKVRQAFILITLLLSLCGCAGSSKSFDETTVIVGKNGKITDAIVEDFDKQYYQKNGLLDMVNEEISQYVKLTGDEDAVKLSRFEIENGKAHVYIDFQDYSDYAAFNKVDFFYGSVSTAYEKGYDMNVLLKSASGTETIGKDELITMGKNNILIVSDKVAIRTGMSILYTSANVEVLDEKQARISSESEGLAYLILK